MSTSKRYLKWSWFREPLYLVAGWYGRPWSLVLQWSWRSYTNLDFSAPILGDCRLGYRSKAWVEHPIYSRHRDEGRIAFDRTSWAEIDRVETENAELDRRVKAFRARRAEAQG